MGLTAVQRQVSAGRRPLVIVARGAGRSLRHRIAALAPVHGVWWDCLDRQELSDALGRRDLVVVGVSDPAFIRGLTGDGNGGD